MIFLCHHLYEELILEYITIKDTLILSHFFFKNKTIKKQLFSQKLVIIRYIYDYRI